MRQDWWSVPTEEDDTRPWYQIDLRDTVPHPSPLISYTITAPATALCPDLLRYEQLGEADSLRGRVVRGVFWLLRIWPT